MLSFKRYREWEKRRYEERKIKGERLKLRGKGWERNWNKANPDIFIESKKVRLKEGKKKRKKESNKKERKKERKKKKKKERKKERGIGKYKVKVRDEDREKDREI